MIIYTIYSKASGSQITDFSSLADAIDFFLHRVSSSDLVICMYADGIILDITDIVSVTEILMKKEFKRNVKR